MLTKEIHSMPDSLNTVVINYESTEHFLEIITPANEEETQPSCMKLSFNDAVAVYNALDAAGVPDEIERVQEVKGIENRRVEIVAALELLRTEANKALSNVAEWAKDTIRCVAPEVDDDAKDAADVSELVSAAVFTPIDVTEEEKAFHILQGELKEANDYIEELEGKLSEIIDVAASDDREEDEGDDDAEG